jgi:hypothetical protein
MTNIVHRFFREMILERRRKWQRPTIDIRDEHFIYTRRRKPLRVLWSDVSQIDAGVLAMVSGDLFYVALVVKGARLEIDEFADGFRLLENAIFARWPDVQAKWLELHKAHAHKDILVTLWKRA